MLFLVLRRAAFPRVLCLMGASFWASSARAEQFSPLPAPRLQAPFAPALEDSTPPSASEVRFRARFRTSKPVFGPRVVPILAPPDGFYQTPAQLEAWLLDLSKSRPRQVTTRVLGKTPGGRRILALEVMPPNISPWKLRRLVVLCRQHGNEPEASASGARFIREFLTSKDPKKRRIAQKTALLIVPIANPDGAAVYRRRTDQKIDMNRDWGHQKSAEVRLLTRWIAGWKPNLVVDVHQWLPREHQAQPMAEASGGQLARQTAQSMSQNNAVRGYVLAARARWGLDTLCHRFWGQRFKIPAILLESRHLPNVPGARDVAIGTSLTALWSAAETLAK